MMFKRKSKRAAVLGCGPTGLFAVHGLIENGWDVTVYSKKRKSHLYGAQYLHAPIPGLTPEDIEPITVKYTLEGNVRGYREKVYGATPINTSVEALQTEHSGWDLRATYDAAWERYADLVQDMAIEPSTLFAPVTSNVSSLMTIRLDRFDLMLSSIPLNSICYGEHQFHAAEIWAMGDAPDRGQTVPYRPAENTVECNGMRDVGWYRASNIYGHATMEWPGRSKPPLPAVAAVTKPIYTDCDCYRRSRGLKFIPIGRYGAWKKSILTHHSYTQAAQL